MNIKKETIQKYIDEVEQHLANKDFKSVLDIAGRYHLDQIYNNGKVQFDSPNKRLTDFIDNHQAIGFLRTPVFNKKEHLEIDPEYSHQAPQIENEYFDNNDLKISLQNLLLLLAQFLS